MENNYLGRWIDMSIESDNIIECISVNKQTKMCIFDNGLQISMFDLDHGDKYEKILDVTLSPEVVNQLGPHSATLKQHNQQFNVLGDLSRVGSTNNKESLSINESLRQTTKTQPNECNETHDIIIDNNPIATFIKAAILLSKKSGGSTKIPVEISLNIDFDILSIVASAQTLGATDVEIMQYVMQEIEIDINEVKRLVIRELVVDDTDAQIVESQRESEFQQVLSEELNAN